MANQVCLGIVVPRYGPDVLAGAETFARHLAEHLPPDEFDVTVLTTCARDLLTWRNEHPPGETHVGGLRVFRFPVDHRCRDVRLFRRLTDRLHRGEPTTTEDQAAWLEHSAHSPELCAYLARHGADYDLLILLPYLFGTTLYGSAVWPKKRLICPCLHDEPYAYFDDVRQMLRSVRGLMFISAPEQALAEAKLGVRHPAARLVGFGLDDFAAARSRASELGVAEDVIRTGRVDEWPPYLHLADVFITASLHDGFGMPLIEAMACGVPVVASRAGAMCWVVDEASGDHPRRFRPAPKRARDRGESAGSADGGPCRSAGRAATSRGAQPRPNQVLSVPDGGASPHGYALASYPLAKTQEGRWRHCVVLSQ